MAREARTYDELWRSKLEIPPRAVPLRFSAAVEGLRPGRRVLDIGCGQGLGHELLAPDFAEVHGVDGTEAALERARARGTRVARVDLEAEALPYPDAHFDAILCLDVVEHLVDPARLVREIARMLQPGGQAVVTTPNARSIRQLARIALAGRGPRTSGDDFGVDGGHLHYFTSRDVAELLERAGLRVVERRGLWNRLENRHLARRWLVRELLSGGVLLRATR